MSQSEPRRCHTASSNWLRIMRNQEAVSFLGEGDARLARLAGNVLVAVQDHLGGEGRMPADLDGQMAPVGVEDVKRIVVHIGIGFFLSMWCFAPTSHTGAWARPTSTRNRPWVTVVLARYSSARSCLRCPAEQSITGMPCALAQPHQVSVFERLIGARQRPPPYTEPARIMAHAEVCVQHNAIDAIVAA